MDGQTLSTIVVGLVGPLLGAGVGTFFGLRYSINGLRERSIRMEETLGEVRDYARDTSRTLTEHTAEAREAHQRIAWLHHEAKSK